jgi:uncharacterized protein (TIRG00374 family)
MKLFIKLLISAVLIGLLIWYMGGISEIVMVIGGANPIFFVFAFIIITLDRALMVYKWKLLLRSRDQHLPFFSGIKIYCSAMIWGSFLPTTIGADAIRAYLTKRLGLNGHEVVASIIVERMVGFVASLLLGLIGLFILASSTKLDDKFDPIWYSGGILLLLAVVLFSASFSRALFDNFYNRLPGFLRDGKIVARLKPLHKTYLSFGADRRSMIQFFNLTFLEQFFSIFYNWAIALTLNIDVGLIFIAGVIPVTMLISRLPISVDGIGVYEGIFVLLMALGGLSVAESLSIALVGRIVQLLSWSPWWLSYVSETGARPPGMRASN